MPKVLGKVLSAGQTSDGARTIVVQTNGMSPKTGDTVRLKWGANRSVEQNNLYWKYLDWVIEYGGMKEHGHFSPEALHEDLKTHFLSEKVMDKGQFKAIETFSTTQLNKVEFGEYFDKIDLFLKEWFEIDTSIFWKDYQDYKGE